jgi:hypothetical protein
LQLGDLAEGKWRVLTDEERAVLIAPNSAHPREGGDPS